MNTHTIQRTSTGGYNRPGSITQTIKDIVLGGK